MKAGCTLSELAECDKQRERLRCGCGFRSGRTQYKDGVSVVESISIDFRVSSYKRDKRKLVKT